MSQIGTFVHKTPTYGKTARGASSPVGYKGLIFYVSIEMVAPATRIRCQGREVEEKTKKTRTAGLAHSGTIVNNLDAWGKFKGTRGGYKSQNTYESGNFFLHGLLFVCS
jgi:hypothetical protein